MMDNGKLANKKNDDGQKRRSKTSALLIAVLLLLLLLSLLFVICYKDSFGSFGNGSPDTSYLDDSLARARADSISKARADSLARARADSLARAALADSLARALADSLAREDSLARARASLDPAARARADSLAKARADSLARARAQADSIAKAAADSLAYALAIADSLARADSIARWQADSLAMIEEIARADSIAADSAAAARRVNPCSRDTLTPWVYADPSGGLHRQAVAVKLVANKKCVIEWSFDGVKDWKEYNGQPINISKAATLYYRATDSCGKKMDVRSKRYEFDMTKKTAMCPQGMEHIKTRGKEFCVDAYEWPNRKGVVPTAYVSLYQAMDSCFSVRKRLCSSDEWTTACAGPEKWRYLYGETYESNACATRDTSVQKSGSKPECRGYFAVFDMSGNLAEWTSTPSPENRTFNNVMGGYWASGNQSRCADVRYSYFPQNRHNPVGFRCCKDAEPQAGSSPERGKR